MATPFVVTFGFGVWAVGWVPTVLVYAGVVALAVWLNTAFHFID